MSNFNDSGYGKRFFEDKLTRLTREISRLADAMEENNRLRRLEESYTDEGDDFFEIGLFALDQERKLREEKEELERKLNDPTINEGIPAKEYEIWCGGNSIHYLGKHSGITFREACKDYALKNPGFAKHFDEKKMTYWGCELFDNEAAARKSLLST